MTLTGIFRICVGFASLGLIYQMLEMGSIKGIVLVALSGIFWLVGQNRNWSWVSHPPFILLSLITGRIMFAEVAPEWGLVILILLLCAWDLEYFIRRLNRRQKIINQSGIERRHLRRLFMVAILGFVSGGLIFNSQFEINLIWITILSISAALGLHFFLASTKSN